MDPLPAETLTEIGSKVRQGRRCRDGVIAGDHQSLLERRIRGEMPITR
jgi:hypothetical protein